VHLRVVAMGKSNGGNKMCHFIDKIIIAPNVANPYDICVFKIVRKLIFAKIHPNIHPALKSFNVRLQN
jgi:hypothetical protein